MPSAAATSARPHGPKAHGKTSKGSTWVVGPGVHLRAILRPGRTGDRSRPATTADEPGFVWTTLTQRCIATKREAVKVRCQKAVIANTIVHGSRRRVMSGQSGLYTEDDRLG
uniref:Uncharacterized protein n=1 Tax=Oryza punctata TaxID=4537 RepID=A0A0E0JTG5_ORYPU